MRAGWQTSKLGGLCSVRRDSGIHNDMNYIGLEHISSGTGCLLSMADTSGVIGTTNLFKEGDVLYGKLRPYLKKVVVADCEGCCSTEILPIRCGDSILPDFLKYWFLEDGLTDKINATCGGCRMPRANMRDVFEFEFAFPSLPEQQRIVDVLDQEFAKIDALKANAERAIQAAKDLFQATLKKELEPRDEWRTAAMGDVSVIARGGSPRPIKAFITEDADGINWIKIGDTEVGGKYISSTKEKIRKEGMRSSRYVEAGDFLLSNSMSFGRPYILKTDGCIHDGWLVIKKYENTFTQDFLYYLLLSPSVVKQFEEGARGSTVRNLNTDIVSAVMVSYPSSLKEQDVIVARVEEQNYKCKALQENYQKTLTLCDDLKQALLRKAFNGEL